MKHYLLLLLVFAFAKTCFGQVFNPSSEASGLATVAEENTWGTAENPANRSLENGFAAKVYGFTPFEVVEVSRFGLDVGYKVKAGFLQLGLQHFGAPGYSISAIHFGAGRRLSEGFHVGIRVGATLANYEEFGSELTPVAQVGIQYKVTNSLSAGAHYTYTSIAQLPLSEHRLRVGVAYQSSPKVHLLLSAWQSVDQRLAGGLGIRYAAADKVTFRAGMRTGGVAFSLGADVKLANNLRLAITAVAYQQIPLGAGYGIEVR